MTNVLPLITPDTFDFRLYMQTSEPKIKVLPADTWRDDLVDVVVNGNKLSGAKLPWSKTHDNIRFRPGEVSLWQGANGHGKSQLLGMVCLGFIAQSEKVCIASFEMTPKATLYRMMKQAAQNSDPSSDFVENYLMWLSGKLWIYDQMGTATPDMLAAVIRYCAEKLKVNHIIIDSLMRVVAGEDNYNAQKDFVGLLCTLARDYQIHVHLVHHVRKLADEGQVPGKFDSKGSGAITDQVDQVLTVWRNKKKQSAVDKSLRSTGSIPQDVKNEPDTLLVCDKNRHGDWEGRVLLWYHSQSLQYASDSRAMPMNLMG